MAAGSNRAKNLTDWIAIQCSIAASALGLVNLKNDMAEKEEVDKLLNQQGRDAAENRKAIELLQKESKLLRTESKLLRTYRV